MLYARKRLHHYVNTVVSMKAAGANQVRTQWLALTKSKLGQVYNVGHYPETQSEFTEDIHKIPAGSDPGIGSAQNGAGNPRSAQMVTGFTTTIIDECTGTVPIAAQDFRNHPRGHGRKQERRVGG